MRFLRYDLEPCIRKVSAQVDSQQQTRSQGLGLCFVFFFKNGTLTSSKRATDLLKTSVDGVRRAGGCNQQ